MEVIRFTEMYGGYGPEFFTGAEVLDFRELSGTRLYIDKESEELIKSKIHPEEVVHLIDTGDYHYMTRLYLYGIKEAFDLLIFDNHNDSQEPAIEGMRSCGSWIKDAISDMGGLISGVKLVQGIDKISDLCGSFDKNKPLYISIDKDVLGKDSCPTNWDQGDMTLPEMIEVLNEESEGRRILGFDICGGVNGDMISAQDDIIKNRQVDKELIGWYNTRS